MNDKSKPENELTSEQIERLLLIEKWITMFLPAVIHELRTPTTTIVGYSQLLLKQEKGTLNQEQRRYVENIRHSGSKLLEIYDYFFFSCGRIILNGCNIEEVDLEQLCEEIGVSGLKKNRLGVLPHVKSDKDLLGLILRMILLPPYHDFSPDMNQEISLAGSFNERYVTLYVTFKCKDSWIPYYENNLSLLICQIGMKTLGGELSWEQPEAGKGVILLKLPVFRKNNGPGTN